MKMEDSIFDNGGTIRTDLDTLEVSPERRPALDALIAAQHLAEAVESEFKRAEAMVTDAVRHRNTIAAKVPRRSFHDEWLASTTHPDKTRG
jgi:hypothetical protein